MQLGRRVNDDTGSSQVINLLGRTQFDLGNVRSRQQRDEESRQYYADAVAQFERTLQIDPENVTAHYNLHLLYEALGDQTQAAEHQRLHLRYKPDDNAQGRAIRLAREKYPAANYAAEAVVKYQLQRSLGISPEPEPQPQETSSDESEPSSAPQTHQGLDDE